MSSQKAERLTDEALIALIELVKNKEFLWNPLEESYKNKHKVADAWAEISEKLNIPEEILKLKWRNVRTIYSKEYKRTKKTKDYVSRWRFYKIMSFLPLRIKPESEGGTESSEEDERIDQSHAHEPLIKFETPETEPQQNGMIYFNHDYSLSATATNRKRKKITQFEEEDYDMLYLKSLLPYFRHLDPVRKLVARSKIQDVLLHEMASQAAVETDTNTPTSASY